HQRAQRFVAAGLRRDDLGEAEAARQRVLFVEAVEFNELRVEQRGAGGVLAVVGQGVAVAVEYFGSAGLEHAQAGPDDVAAQRRQPPLLLAMRAHGASDHSHSRPARTRPRMITDSAIRAGVARPLSEVSGVAR